MANIRVDWANPLANILDGPDAPNLRRLFADLSRWLSFPLICLERNAAQSIATATDIAITWPTETHDESQLHVANASSFQTPRGYNSYLAVGAVSMEWASNSTAGYRLMTLRKNGAQTLWRTYVEHPAAARSAPLALPFILPLKSSDTLDVIVRHNVGVATNLEHATIAVLYLPMT